MSNPVVHFEIGGPDLEALAAFYAGMFGWEAVGDDEYRLVATDGGIGGGLMRCVDGMPSYVTVYVAVDDLEVALADAVRLGGTTALPPTPIPGVGSFALFEDPAGNVVGLMHEDGLDPTG